MADKKGSEPQYGPPPKVGKWVGFKTFLWNSETSQCLGRTGSSWAKIIFFYIIFYAVLAGFFGAMLAVFYTTLENDRPKWTLESGLIGTNPGLGFRPMPPEENVESTLIWYVSSREDNYKYWVDENARFLKTYINVPKQNQVKCNFDSPPPAGKVCSFEEDYQACTEEKKFGYNMNRPCIFLKLNKIYNWMPEIYNDSKNLPDKMPETLKQHIAEKQSMRPNETNLVWVSCEGENPADNENIRSTDYYPRMGFPSFYFPYKNIDGYTPPLVAVQFTVQTGVLINIECKAWARNINHDRAERRGSVHFELMVD